MDFVDVFVGTDRTQLLAVAVLEHSILRHTKRPVRVCPLIDLGLPEPKDVRHRARTNFSFARFAIPELKDYRGTGIYMDADMLVFSDISSLADIPFDGAKIIIQESVPEYAVMSTGGNGTWHRKKQCSVMLIDCNRTKWDAPSIIAGLDGAYNYDQLMTDMCILKEDEIKYGVPFEWNSLEHYEHGKTNLIHYTDMHTQPWVCPFNKFGWLWMKEVRLMLDTHKLSWADIQLEIDMGHMRPSLIMELQELPHQNGFEDGVAKRYDQADRAAGFVKHAFVYARKKEREAAVKRYNALLAQQQSVQPDGVGALPAPASPLIIDVSPSGAPIPLPPLAGLPRSMAYAAS